VPCWLLQQWRGAGHACLPRHAWQDAWPILQSKTKKIKKDKVGTHQPAGPSPPPSAATQSPAAASAHRSPAAAAAAELAAPAPAAARRPAAPAAAAGGRRTARAASRGAGRRWAPTGWAPAPAAAPAGRREGRAKIYPHGKVCRLAKYAEVCKEGKQRGWSGQWGKRRMQKKCTS
jgi:hypothetical protein